MTHKKPDLENRGGNKVLLHSDVDTTFATGDGYEKSDITITVPRLLAVEFREACQDYGLSHTDTLRRLFYSACREMAIDTTMYDNYEHRPFHGVRNKSAFMHLEFSRITLDECDMPGVAEPQELGDFDPYFCTLYGEAPDYGLEPGQRRSWKLRELNQAIERCVLAIEDLSHLKRWTNVFTGGQISKAEARKELKQILDLLPAEIGDTLWGWCSVNDAINLVTRWQKAVTEEMLEQIKIENIRMQARERHEFEAYVERSIQSQKQRILDTYKKQKRVRPQHGEDWPTWAGQMESYLDYASHPTNQNPKQFTPGNHAGRQHNAVDLYPATKDGKLVIEKVQSTCTINLSEGLTNETK